MKMGGVGRMVEGDGMFVAGKRKCGVGRYHSKEHVYVCLERGSRKIRRLVVRDKSAEALHLLRSIYCLTPRCMSISGKRTRTLKP